MRIIEVIHENKNNNATSSGMSSYPDADSPYWKYRLGVAAAGSPDFDHDYKVSGPAAGDMVSSHYSDADKDIMSNAHKKMGFKPSKVSPTGSKEPEDTYKVSPVSNWMKK
jgi:hypothetical protein